MMSSALTHPKTFTHSANIAMTESACTVTALALASQSKIEKQSENIPFTSTQGQIKIMSDFFNSTNSKLAADFSSDSPAEFRTESTESDSYAIKRLKKKLQKMKQSCSFAKESGKMERTKPKMESIESIEDQLE